ncbi:MAG: GAF domain-containing protein [Anaerolineae bacterium]|nr:GAF domain-containing protein [Anaerolineae bacterium]
MSSWWQDRPVAQERTEQTSAGPPQTFGPASGPGCRPSAPQPSAVDRHSRSGPTAADRPGAETQRLFSLLDALPAIVYVKAPDYSIRFANRFFRERFGDPSGRPCYELIHAQTGPCEICGGRSTFADGETAQWEWTFDDGASFQLYDYPLFEQEGGPLTLQLGIDITSRKKAEAGLELANAELRAVTRAEREQRRFAEGLAQAVLALNSSLNWTEVLDRILDQTLQVIPCRAATVLLLRDDQVCLARQRGLDITAGDLSQWQSGIPLSSIPALEHALRERRSMQIPDLAAFPEPVSTSVLPWLRSVVAVPMVRGNDLVGLIALLADEPGFFTAQSLTRLEAFASHAVVAIENARLYQAESEAARNAEFLSAASLSLSHSLELGAVLDNLLDILTYLVPYDVGRVSLLTANDRLVVRAMRGPASQVGQEASRPVDLPANPYLADLLHDSKSVWLPNTQRDAAWQACRPAGKVRSYLGVPLIAAAKTIGLCELERLNGEGFSQQHLWWVEALSGLAAVAVQNAQLFEEMRERREQLQLLSRRLVEVQEQERRYIARELHDEAGQALTSLMIQLKLLQRQSQDPAAVFQGTAELLGVVEGLMENLHRLAVDLRPASLDHVGLVAALEQHCQTLSRQNGLPVTLEASGIEGRLSAEAETALYRIVQEALSNALRHARATRVDVVLQLRDGRIVVLVEDNGRGFDPTESRGSGRLGLAGMRERAEGLGGTFAVESHLNAGTSIIIEVPYVHQDSHRR